MKPRRVLLLSCFMLRGYGVSVVASELQRRLTSFGWDMHIGFLECDLPVVGLNRLYMPADTNEILSYCARQQIDVVIAQTPPYFEVLPSLVGRIPVVCFDHGDPTPELFMSEAETRSQRKENKIDNVFPKVSDVWTISHFLRHDIGWPAAKVVPNGADHVNVGHVGRERKTEIVRVGFLSRLGQLEAEYKGNDLFVGLAERFTDDKRVEFLVMGRGNREDIAVFKQAGISVRLNATDDERAAFFRDVDVFFSPSRWEGFNLPLAEAQYAGCAAFAFDVGAHPETTPFVVGSLSDAEILLRHWLDNPASLKAAGERCQRFVKDRFTWEVSARRFADLLNDVSPSPNRWPALMRRVRLVIRRDGIRGLGRKLAGRFLRR